MLENIGRDSDCSGLHAPTHSGVDIDTLMMVAFTFFLFVRIGNNETQGRTADDAPAFQMRFVEQKQGVAI